MAECHEIVSDPFTVNLINIKASQLCRRADFSRSDYDDLRQDMRLHLLEKAHLFDPARGNLEAFVTSALKTWAIMRVRYRKREKRSESYKAVSLERTPVECDGEVTTLGTVLLEEDGGRLTGSYPISAIEQFEMREDVQRVMQHLEPQDRALLAQVAEHGIRAVAKSRGTSWRQVHNEVVRIRRHFEKAGLGPN